MSSTLFRTSRLLLIVTTLASLPAAASGQTGPHGQWFMWPDGTTFTTFGANATVMIEAGKITNLGDWLYPTADVYVVKTGTVGNNTALVDQCGAPNTVIGGLGGIFYLETIGFSKPTGCLDAGTYAIVFDEHQNGVFNAADDALFDPAFTVVLPAIPPPIDPAITAIKQNAGAQRDHWQGTLRWYAVFYGVAQVARAVGSVGHSLVYLATDSNGACVGKDPMVGTAFSILNTIKQYHGLHADPPEPDYQHLTPLDPGGYPDSRLDDSLYRTSDRLAGAVSDEAAVAKALLASIERYQGAANAGDGEWCLIHARAARDHAYLLAAQLGRTSAALAAQKQALGNYPIDLDAVSQEAEQLRLRLEQQGFSPDETAILLALGLDAAEIDQLAARFADFSWLIDDPDLAAALGGPLAFTDYDEATLVAAIDTILLYNPTAAVAYQSDAALLQGIVTNLEGQPAVLQRYPVADAGGFYWASEGSAVLLDATASFDPDGQIVLYEWDLDRDGQFDDASSTLPYHWVSFGHPLDGMIGLRVTDDSGRHGIAYAGVAIDESLEPPHVVSSSPETLCSETSLDEPLCFSVLAENPNPGGVLYQWTVDGTSVPATTSSFEYSPSTPGEVGLHDVRVVVATSNPLGGETVRQWMLGVSQDGFDWGEVELYCFGGTACPCGNRDTEAGCSNSTGEGARLSVSSGTVSVGADDLEIITSDLPADQFCMVFMGAGRIAIPFGDGLRCVGAGGVGIFRFPVQNAGPGGSVTYGPGIAAHSHTAFGPAGGIDPGETWRFQNWYRDPSGPCAGSFNLSNGLSVTFAP